MHDPGWTRHLQPEQLTCRGSEQPRTGAVLPGSRGLHHLEDTGTELRTCKAAAGSSGEVSAGLRSSHAPDLSTTASCPELARGTGVGWPELGAGEEK